MNDSEASKAIFVTTSESTEPAQKYADKYNIENIAGNGLVRLIHIASDSLD